MYYSYDDFTSDLRVLKEKVDTSFSKPDALLAIARGGLTMAHFLAMAWDINKLYVMNASSYDANNKAGELRLFNIPEIPPLDKKVLIIDEIVDSGASLKKISEYFTTKYPEKEFKTAVIFQKQEAIYKADFSLKENAEWIDFFWEVWHKKA